MTVTLEQCLGIIRHTLGGAPSPDIDQIALCNEAGDYLVSMHPWGWLQKVTQIVLVDDAETISMPSDFRSIEGIESPINLGGTGVEMETMQIVLDYRRGALAPPIRHHVGALVSVHPATGGDVTWRLEVWPKVDFASGGSSGHPDRLLDVIYLRSWKTLDDDNNVALLDKDCVALYKEILRAFARGAEEEDEAPLDARLALISNGTLFANAKKIDGERMGMGGKIQNSAIDMAHRRAGEFRSGTLADPS